MNKITRYLTSICLLFGGYIVIGTLQANTSIPDFVADAAKKTNECHLASRTTHTTGRRHQQAQDCVAACFRVYNFHHSGRYKDNEKKLQTLMARCLKTHKNYLSESDEPTQAETGKAILDQAIPMPATLEEMATQMRAMKPDRRVMRDACGTGANIISRGKVDYEGAKYHWERCVAQYKRRKANRAMQ